MGLRTELVGRGASAAAWPRHSAARASATRERIHADLWDPERRIFANRLWSGAFVRSLGPTSFYPLAAGAAAPDRVGSLLGHLADPATFGEVITNCVTVAEIASGEGQPALREMSDLDSRKDKPAALPTLTERTAS